VLAVDGRDDLGGLDIDAALVEHIGKFCAEQDAEIWQRLTEPGTLEDRRAKRQLWDDVRIAKERLSRLQSADVVVPLLDLELHVTRDELEELARPVLDQTVQVTRDLLRWADLAEGRLAGVFLVGGASRIPLVATLLHRALGEAPVVIEQPELVVAEGSILADAALLASEPAAPGPTSEMRLLSRQTQQPSTPAAPAAAPAPPTAVSPATSPAAASAPRMSADDMETVPSSRDQLLPPPAVDPWPDAQQHWVPDPEQTVASDPSWDLHALPKTPPPPTRSAAAAAATQPVRRPEAASRPVSPSASRPVSPPGARTASGSVISRPVSPPARPAAGTRPGHTTTFQAPRKPAAPRKPVPPRRRRAGGALRFLQVFLSVLMLVTVPLAAMVVAYGVSADVSMPEAARFILEDLQRLLERV
jgi:hypothetical protein